MLHTIILFIHVVSATGIFAAMGVESMVLGQLGRATDDASAGAAFANYKSVQRVGGPSMGLTLLAGLTLAGMYWGWRLGWIDVALASIVLFIIVDVTLSGRTHGKLKGAATASAVHAAVPTLRKSLILRVWILAGIVFLMTNKLALWPSVIVIAVAFVLGVITDAVTGARESSTSAQRSVSEAH